MDIYYYIRYQILERAWYEFKYAWQRVFRGYDDRARWGLSYHIAEISLPILKEYRDEGVGHPCRLTEKEWKDRLQVMIEGFEAYHKADNLLYTDFDSREEYLAEHDRLNKIYNRGIKCFAENFRDLWD